MSVRAVFGSLLLCVAFSLIMLHISPFDAAATARAAPGEWVVVATPTTSGLNGIDAVAEDLIYAVGGNYFAGQDPIVLKYNGSAWTVDSTFDSFNQHFQDVSFVDPSHGWAVGYQIFSHYQNGNWQHTQPNAEFYYGIDMLNDQFGVNVGFYYEFVPQFTQYGSIQVYNGSSWQETGGRLDETYLDVAMLNADEGWVVGDATGSVWAAPDRAPHGSDSGIILHRSHSGSSWQPVHTTGAVLHGVSALAADNVWAVGGSGTIVHFNGANWQTVPSPVNADLRAVAMTSEASGWIVGEGGTILHYDGASWQSVPAPVSTDLRDVAVLPSGEAWAVGRNGVILYFEPADPIVSAARVDLGMPYSEDRGCVSPYDGCGGPYSGFYAGVCTDLVLDAYNGGAAFDIQTALEKDDASHPGRYRFGTARSAEDMRRYFDTNQHMWSHGDPYQVGDIAFFDWNGDGIANHAAVIAAVDSANRPLMMVDATGAYEGNPSGRAIEHAWNGYYDQHVHGHARLGDNTARHGSGPLPATASQALRVQFDAAPVDITLFDANGKYSGSNYDENLVASNVETFIPYIPGGRYAVYPTGQTITVTHPLSNSTAYRVQIAGEPGTTYSMTIETLEDTVVTDAASYTATLDTAGVQHVSLTLSDQGGALTFDSTAPVVTPVLLLPDTLHVSGTVGEDGLLAFGVAETGGQYPVDDVLLTISTLYNQQGGSLAADHITLTPHVFDLAAGTTQLVTLNADFAGAAPGIYQGSVIVTTATAGSYRVPLTVDVGFRTTYLPLVVARE